MSATTPIYRFEPFELRTQTRELFKYGVKLKLRPQACRVLVVLLERAGEGVSREELRDRLWPSDTFVDFEHGLNTAIKELRAALSDSASEPRYIETLPKFGYRVIVPVNLLPRVFSEPVQETHPKPAGDVRLREETKPPVVGSIHFGNRRRRAILGIAALLITGVIAFVRWQQPESATQKSAGIRRTMVAVLPFENLTGDEGQDYLSDGLTEEMIAHLGRLDPQEFGVIARTSVMHFKHTTVNIEQIGSDLGVQYVLEGSVRRDSGKLRINAQLIEVRGQTHLWAQEYDRELTNLLSVQTEIAYEIADAIQLTLGDPKAKVAVRKSTLTPQAYQAYDLYLKGLFFWNKRTLPGFQQAIEYFRQAIGKDPTYAPAYAGLANSYTLSASYGLAPASKYMPQARAAALRALELDDSLPEAHTALALVVENYDWDWNTSEKEFRRAIELNPNYATAHHWYAEHLMWQGRFAEAFKESEIARRLDPLSLIINTDYAAIFYYSRQYDRAIEQFRAVMDMDPKFPRALMVIDAYVEKEMYPQALAMLETSRRESGDAPWIHAKLARVYGRSGQKEKAREELEKLEKLEKLNKSAPLDPAIFAVAYLGAGDKKEALTLLERAYEQHSNILTTIEVEPAYDALRSEPRFEELLRRVGLAK